MRFILSLVVALFLLCFLAKGSEAKALSSALKKETAKPVIVDILDKNAKKLSSAKGSIDNKGIVTTKCELIVKYLKEAETVLVVKTGDGKLLGLRKILFCNLKRDLASFHTKIHELVKQPPPIVYEHLEEAPDGVEESYNAQDWFQKGIEYQESRKLARAENAFNQALKLKPDFYEVYINLGNVYFVTGRYTEAIESYNYAAKKMDYKNAVYNKIGTSYFLLGDYYKSIEAFKKAKYEENNPETLFSLGVLYFLVGNKEDAFNEYVSLTKVNRELAESLFDLLYR